MHFFWIFWLICLSYTSKNIFSPVVSMFKKKWIYPNMLTQWHILHLRSCTTLQYNPRVQVCTRQSTPNSQIDLTSIPYGQSQGYIKISQGNKKWLEWFPSHTLLNLPNSSTIAIDITEGVLHILTHP